MTENNQTRIARRKQKKNRATQKPLFKRILFTILAIGSLIAVSVGAIFIYYIATAPTIDAAKLSDPYSSKIYNKDGEEVADFGSVQRTKVEYDDLPQVLIDAVTATEDVRFFKHSGIDIRRIGAAIKANITDGFGSEGASTITQQVVENAFLTKEKKLKLKVQEQWLALKLEREYSKEQIMEMYLNKIFYGSGAYGVAKASEIYFGKTDLHELNLVEAAILAGLPQRPSAYNPYENPDLMQKRVNTVLKLMVRHGKITEEEAEEARQVDISSLLSGKRPNTIPYEAFIQKVRKEVSEKLDANIDTDGLKIYTTLDNEAQDHVEFLLKDSEDNPIPYPDDEMQAGMVVLDTQSGAIRAIGGRRNSDGLDEYNFAYQGGQQPGSSFKPLVSYGPAIEYNKWSTYHQINDDKPYEVAGSDPIRNWNRQYQGWMSARYALTWSLNVPTLKILEETGLDNAQAFAEGLGIEFADDKLDIRDAIGGTGTNTTPMQLAGAFRAFGNDGIYNEPYAVVKVEYPDGTVVDLKPEPEAAMSDFTAYMVTDMLKSVITEGTGTQANIPGLHVAGKTGTTNLKGKDGSPDSWFTGYTTNYTISVWTGGYTDEDGNRDVMPTTKIPHELFKNTMIELSKGIETKDFVKPDSVVELPVQKGSNPPVIAKNGSGSNVVTELFVKGHEPNKTSSQKVNELDPVSNLKASYDDDANKIEVTWDYDDDDVQFEVSASVNGGDKKNLSSTEDKSITISEVQEGTEYVIQVTAVSKDDASVRSEPKSVNVKISGDSDDDDEEEEIPAVNNLSAKYDDNSKLIDVSWGYDGPPASFEVDVNGQVQTVGSNGIEISGASPGVYTIKVTPIGQQGANEGVRGDSQTTSIEIKQEEQQDQDPQEDQDDKDKETSTDDDDESNDNNEDDNGDENNSEDDENQNDDE